MDPDASSISSVPAWYAIAESVIHRFSDAAAAPAVVTAGMPVDALVLVTLFPDAVLLLRFLYNHSLLGGSTSLFPPNPSCVTVIIGFFSSSGFMLCARVIDSLRFVPASPGGSTCSSSTSASTNMRRWRHRSAGMLLRRLMSEEESLPSSQLSSSSFSASWTRWADVAFSVSWWGSSLWPWFFPMSSWSELILQQR